VLDTDQAATTIRPYLVLLVVGVGTLVNTLAGSSVNLALPVIGEELGVTVEHSRWVVLGFMLIVTVLLLVAGRVSDLLGHRAVYQMGFALFGLASLVAGASRGFAMLVAGRVLQGAGAAMIMATGPALLTTSFPGAQRGRALGMLATATYIGLTIGPPVGGALIAGLSWRWIFYLNVPVAAGMVVLGQVYLPSARGRGRAARTFDAPGAAAIFIGAPLTLLAVTQGQSWGWGSPWTLACAGTGLAALVLFVRIEARRAEPLLDLSLFSSRVFTGAVLSALANYIGLFVPIILMPFYLLEGIQLGPSSAGLLLSVQPLVMAVVASPSGWLSDRIGTRGLAVSGMAALACGLGGLATVGPNTSTGLVALWLGVMGLGTGVFISPNSSALMGAAPRHQQGIAGGILAEARTVGMLIGVTMGTAVFAGMGGQTGRAWGAADFSSMSAALLVAMGVSLLGALSAAFRTAATRTG
jgi:EmrB/QacA subfamily drug resistance transporter